MQQVGELSAELAKGKNAGDKRVAGISRAASGIELDHQGTKITKVCTQ